MAVWVTRPTARNMMVTPKKMRNELKTRPAVLSVVDFRVSDRGDGDQRHVERVERAASLR